MVTVDDLVISLTIKETGRLGRLQKQLDSLVGKKGKGITRFTGALMYMKKDLNFIKKQITWLRPSRLPTARQPRQLRKLSGSVLADLEDFQEEIVNKLLTTPPKGIKALYEEFEVTTTEELKKKMVASIEKVKETVGDIWGDISILSPAKREIVLHTLSRLIAESMSDREIGLEFWRAIAKFTPEEAWKGEILELFRTIGVKATPEKPLYMVKPEALILEEVQKKLGIIYPTQVEKIFKAIEEGNTDIDYEVREIKDFFVQKKFKDILGLSSPDLNVITEHINEIMEAGGEKQIAQLLEKLKIGFIRDIIPYLVPEETKNELDKLVKKSYGWSKTATEGAKRIDIAVADIEALKGELGIKIQGLGEVGFELKRILSRENIKQLLMYMKFYGKENIVILTEQVKGGVMDYLKSLGLEENVVILPAGKFRGLQTKYDLAKKLVDPKSEEFKDDIRKMIENVKTYKFEEWEKIFDPTTSEEDRQRIMEEIQEFKHRVGVNPNWVDLPGWTQNIGDQIREIRKQTEKIGTVESNELLEKFLELRDKLDITMTPENLNAFISDLTRTYHDMENMPMPELEKREIKYSMLKTIVSMRMKEWKTLQEEYAQFPTLIIESLKDIKDKTQEYQELKEAVWKKTLLGKMEVLIKSVSDYRNELRTTIGRKYTEPPQEKLHKDF